MLIRFRVGNYKSINEPVELVFRAPKGDGAPLRGGTSVAAIYGANASGKTNVLDAFLSMRRAVVHSHANWRPNTKPPREPFALDPETVGDPSLFEADFILNETRYQYGFTVGDESFLEEWLYSYPETRRRILFERSGRSLRFGRALRGSNRIIADLVRPNSLFLSAAASNNHEELAPLYQWFENISFAGLGDSSSRGSISGVTEEMLGTDQRESVTRLVALADLGISDVVVREEEVKPELKSAMDELFVKIHSIADASDTSPPVAPATQTQVLFEHTGAEGRTIQIPYGDESRGTQMWFSHVGPVLRTLHRGGILVVDELDASLHPRLSSEIIRLFSDAETNQNKAQLIFSSHDTTLLGNLVRQSLDRDDVWFTEKGQTGATLLYPLSEFRPRKKEALERRYLEGRYGAVPIVDLSGATLDSEE